MPKLIRASEHRSPIVAPFARFSSSVRMITTLALVSCADSHPPPASCASDEDCAEGVCVGASDGHGLCLLECDYAVAQRCGDGSWCRASSTLSYCWPGGATVEGEVEGRRGDCAFGLAHTPDYTTEPRGLICEPVCNTSEDCRSGELCANGRCTPPCSPSYCEPPNRCALGTCVNERRFARIDCDADGTPECYPGLVCDADAIGGCAHPPRGEE